MTPISGVIRPSTTEVTTAVNAEPMTTATARSTTFPREMNSLNSLNTSATGQTSGVASLHGSRARTVPKPSGGASEPWTSPSPGPVASSARRSPPTYGPAATASGRSSAGPATIPTPSAGIPRRARSTPTASRASTSWCTSRAPASATSASRPNAGKVVLESRTHGTALIARTLAAHGHAAPGARRPASAVGFYGSRGDEVLTEQSPPGDDFVAALVEAWEAAARPAADAGIRTVFLRTAPVLSARRRHPAPHGAAVPALRRWPHRLGPAVDELGRARRRRRHRAVRDRPRRRPWPRQRRRPRAGHERRHDRGPRPRPAPPHAAPRPSAALRLVLGDGRTDSLLLASQRVEPAAPGRGRVHASSTRGSTPPSPPPSVVRRDERGRRARHARHDVRPPRARRVRLRRHARPARHPGAVPAPRLRARRGWWPPRPAPRCGRATATR